LALAWGIPCEQDRHVPQGNAHHRAATPSGEVEAEVSPFFTVIPKNRILAKSAAHSPPAFSAEVSASELGRWFDAASGGQFAGPHDVDKHSVGLRCQ
jgi:hypothetical protein